MSKTAAASLNFIGYQRSLLTVVNYTITRVLHLGSVAKAVVCQGCEQS